MQEIQNACARLGTHADKAVVAAAAEIRELDQDREREHLAKKLEWEAEKSTLNTQLKASTAEIEMLQFQLGESQNARFGSQSEQSKTREQGKRTSPKGSSNGKSQDDKNELPFEDDLDGDETSEQSGTRGGRKGEKPFPDHLPRKVVEVPEHPSTLCACGCGCRALPPGVFERLKVIPAKLVVIQEMHQKSVCRNCGQIAYAKPDRTFDCSRYGTSMTVAALMDKYADGLPHYRQAERYRRAGFTLDRSTLMRLARRGSTALEPIFELMKADLLGSGTLHMDETPLPQLDPGRGKVKKGYLWTLLRDQRNHLGNQPPCAVFEYAGSRAGLHAEEMLDGFQGKLHVDAYAGYNRLTQDSREGGPIELSYCWAHVRRKFHELVRTGKQERAQHFLDRINALFEVERRIKRKSHIERRIVRQMDTLPLVDALFVELKQASIAGMKKSPLGAAISYTLALEDGLRLFLDNGRLEISNNPVENIIRHVAIVRKNALFAGSEVGGEHWGIIQSIISTCKLNGINPEEYLEWVFKQMEGKLPRSKYDNLLPWNCPLPRHKK